jgi:protein O-mannosyl-transferase
VILLFIFLDKLFYEKKTAVAFIAALLFALHPIHTEVVANIKSRDELLCFFFAFLCLNIFIKYVETGKIIQLLLGSFCFLLSFLSKETVVTFMAIIPFIFFFIKNENKKRSIYITISIAVVTIICLVARFEVLSYYHANNASDTYFIDNALTAQKLPPSVRIATAILILGLYFKLLFIPYPLSCDYSYNTIPFTSFSDPMVLVSLMIYISLAAIAIIRFLKDHKDPYAFAIIFFLVTLSLFSNIPFLIGAAMGERFLFFPSVGFCLLIGLFLERWVGKDTKTTLQILKHPKTLAVLIPVSIIYAFTVINRNKDWSDNYTLYSMDLKKVPVNSKLNYLIGSELMHETLDDQEKDENTKKQKRKEAISFMRKAVTLYPDYMLAQADLGDAYYYDFQYDSAEVHLSIALKGNSENSSALNDMGGIYFFRKDYPKAIDLYRRAFEANTSFVNPCANIGVCYLFINKFDSAVYYTKKAISVDPGFKSSYEILASVYKAAGNVDSAKKYEAVAQKNNPGFKL